MKKINLLLLTTLLALSSSIYPALATQSSQPHAVDSRIQTYIYNPDEVYKFTGHYRYQSSIELSPDENVKSISVGDSFGWQIVPSGSRIFLKPIEQDATTNMTVITDQRIYLFELHAEEAEGINDGGMVFSVRFTYPESDGGISSTVKEFAQEDISPIDIENNAEDYNFNYSLTGSRLISPIKIFDDGEFTYLEFRDKNADVPAIFMVDGAGFESAINFRTSGNYIVVERVASQFTLRHGDDVACVFNEDKPLEKKVAKEDDEKVLGIF